MDRNLSQLKAEYLQHLVTTRSQECSNKKVQEVYLTEIKITV